MGTLLTKAIEVEFENPSPTLTALLRKLIREEITTIVSEELGGMKAEPVTQPQLESGEPTDLHAGVTHMLHLLGIPAHVKGYQYMRDAITMLYNDMSLIGAVTKKLYPAVAEKYYTTPSRVERAIRHAIELSWGKPNDGIAHFFGQSYRAEHTKPTNSHYIATIADRLRIERSA